MEAVENTTIFDVPLEKVPHLQITRKSIETLTALVALLNKRKEIINNPEAVLSVYESNERQIQLIKTDIELAKAHSTIVQKEMYFKQFAGNVMRYIKEMETDWDKVMGKAQKKSQNDKDLAELLKTEDPAKFEENWEYKINFFIQVKTKVYPNRGGVEHDAMQVVK